MKKLLLILLVLSFFFLLIYASSEPSRNYRVPRNDSKFLSIKSQALTFPTHNSSDPQPSLSRLRTCPEDEFNCNPIGEDYTQCVKRFKICNHQIKCSNDDQIECPLCDKNFIYCDLNVNDNKCVELKQICSDAKEQSKCSANQTDIENLCQKFRLSQPNRPTTTQETPTITQTNKILTDSTPTDKVTSVTSSNDELLDNKTTTNSLKTTFTTDFSTSTVSQTYNSITESSTDSTSKLSTTQSVDDFTDRTTINSRSTESSTSETTNTISNRPTSTEKSTFTGPKNIMDYSRMFKHDYGGFNFSDFIFKGNNKKGEKFDYHSFMGGNKKDGDKKSSFYDYSKYMSGGNGGFDYSKFMSGGGNGGFDYSKYMSGYQGSKKSDQNDTKKDQSVGFDYSQYLSQYTGGNGGFDYSKYTNSGSNQKKDNKETKNNDYSQYTSGQDDFSKYMDSDTKKDGKAQAWGQGNFDYTAYRKSGLNSQKSKGGDSYKNEIKSGQKNQDKYAKGHFDYSNYADSQGGAQKNNQTKNGGYDSYYSNYLNGQSNQSSSGQQGGYDYSKYTNNNQQASSKETLKDGPKENVSKSDQPVQQGGFDYSKYTKGGFDYSKFMSGGGNGGFDYSKYMSGYQSGGAQPNLKGSKSNDLIRLTGSKQPTKSFTSFFDYSKFLKPGGNQLDDSSSSKKASHKKAKDLTLKLSKQESKQLFHKAPYIKNFKNEIIKMQEDNQNKIRMQTDEKMNNDKNINFSDMNSSNEMSEPILTKSDQKMNEQNLETEKEQAEKEGYHHIEMQNQVPQYQPKQIGNKEPSVNVSKIIPNMMTNKYNYTHYGSGVFFINFGTIVNGNNNINGNGNDVGNGNGNGNNNGNTQGDGLKQSPYDLNSQSNQKASASSPEDSNAEQT